MAGFSIRNQILLLVSKPKKLLPPSTISSLHLSIPCQSHSKLSENGDRLTQQIDVSSNLLMFRNANRLRCYCRSFFDPKLEAQKISFYKEPAETTTINETIWDGIKALLGDSDLDEGHRLLCFQVVVEEYCDKLLEKFRQTAYVRSPPEDQAAIVTGILTDYADDWVQSCSIVLEKVNHLHSKVPYSDIRGREKANNKQSNSPYTEVTLFVLANCEISDDEINNSEQLEEFLSSPGRLGQTQKVHVTFSSARFFTNEKSECTHFRLARSFCSSNED